MDMISIRRKLMASGGGSTAILATATGNPLSFETDMVRPLKSLVIPFTPIQAAGTPSPDNPLPISGWTGCEIEHGEFVTDNIVTLPVAFTDPTTGDPMTVYGGTLTLNEDGSADLVVDKAAADLSTLTWSQLTKTRYVTEDLATTMPAARNNDTKIGCISEKYTEYTQNRLYGGKSDPATIGMSVSNMHQLCIRTAQSYSDWGDTPSGKFVYPLMNPVSYHFDDVGQLITFLGTNTIWTDTNGTNTATYLKHQS